MDDIESLIPSSDITVTVDISLDNNEEEEYIEENDKIHSNESAYKTKKTKLLTIVYSFMNFLSALCNIYPFAKLYFYLRFGDIIVFMVLILINVILLITKCSGHCDSNLKTFGKRTGDLLQYNFILLLIPITRKGLFYFVARIGFERIILFHRWLGRWIFVLCVIHGLTFVVYYLYFACNESCFMYMIDKLILDFNNFAGTISFIFILVIVLTSLPIVRRKIYFLFIKFHYVCFMGSIGFGLLHHHKSQFVQLLIIPLGFYIIDLAIRFILFIISKEEISSLSLIGNNYIRLDIKNYTRYSPGQYIFIYIPSIGKFESHPFSISTSSEVTPNASLLIEVQNRWTKRLREQLLEDNDNNSITSIWIDGPYGKMTIPSFDTHPFIVLIAGGIGISPILSLLSFRCTRKHYKPLKMILIWSCKNQDLFDEFATDITNILENSENNLSLNLQLTGNDAIDIPLDITSSQIPYYRSIQHGRCDFNILFNKLAKEAKLLKISNIAVYACGPKEFNKSIIYAATPRKDCVFNVHTEFFS